jgi:DNA-directed RNA polymerase specialized sigma24 family protein
MNRHYSDRELLDGIRKGDNKYFVYAFNQYINSIRSMLRHFPNTRIEANDVMARGLLKIQEKELSDDPLVLNASFHTILYSYCFNEFRNLRSAEQRMDERIIDLPELDDLDLGEVKSILDQLATDRFRIPFEDIFWHCFYRISLPCQQKLRMKIQGLKKEEILGFLQMSPGYYDLAKHRCMNYIRKCIRENPALGQYFPEKKIRS